MNNSLQKKLASLAFVAVASASPAALAGVGSSLMQTATVLNPGQFEAKAQADIIFNNDGGFNISPHFAAGLVEHYLDGEIYFGTGTHDFFGGAIAKYNLLPDIEGQIGLALNLGAAYIRDSVAGISVDSMLLTFGILGSKRIETDFGAVSPYGSFQFEGLINDAANTVPLTLIAGARWQFNKISPWNFYSEATINLNKSFWGVAVGAGFPF